MPGKMPPSEYGGSDTVDTYGAQPAPHVLTADEQLRVNYASDPGDVEPLPTPGLITGE